MPDSTLPSAEALAEWRENPVTLALAEGVRRTLDRQEAAFRDLWWQGSPPPEQERLALMRARAAFEDLFESSHEDLMTTLERDG